MKLLLLLVPFLALQLHSSSSSSWSILSEAAPLNTAAMYCTQGFGSSSTGSSSTKIKIQPHQINDGHCDCPHENGIDEPDTDACSGSTDWAGIPPPDDDQDATATITCPQQPNVVLSKSKINDGICDCCDGFDEENNSAVSCVDNCDEVLQQERERQKKLKQDFLLGSKQYRKSIEEYDNMVEEQVESIEKIRNVTSAMKISIEEQKNEVKKWKLDFWKTYTDFMSTSYDTSGKLLQSKFEEMKIPLEFNDDSNAETVKFYKKIIYSICHLYGEMITADDDGNLDNTNDFTLEHDHPNTRSCIPLRLAGIDIRLLWLIKEDGSNYEVESPFIKKKYWSAAEKKQKAEEFQWEVATTILGNHDTNGVKKSLRDIKPALQIDQVWEKALKAQKRNKSKEKDDDLHIDDDAYDSYYDDDDDSMREYNAKHLKETKKKGQEGTDVIDQIDTLRASHMGDVGDILERARMAANRPLIEELKTNEADDEMADISKFFSPFGELLRQPFLDHANILLADIAYFLEDDLDHDEVEEDEEVDRPNIDPMALTMIRNVLNRKLQQIDRGNKIAESAKAFVELLETQKFEDPDILPGLLKKLLIGTIYHSNIFADDIFEILSLASIDTSSIAADSCFDWYYTLCGEDVSKHLRGLCDERNKDMMGSSCEEEEVEIPTNISDGYMNFYEAKTRKDDDYFSQLFNNIDSAKLLFKGSEDIEITENKIWSAEDEFVTLQEKANEARRFANDAKYGPEGVLYSMRDECVDISANQWNYELCMFGKTVQREEGKGKKGSGTSLGSWSDYSFDEETGDMVFKWEEGLKCWNGPQRSATVFVTCGAENKLLSADEPNICEYEFKMESYVACNDQFKNFHNIEA